VATSHCRPTTRHRIQPKPVLEQTKLPQHALAEVAGRRPVDQHGKPRQRDDVNVRG
jgi:hypothetical protein